MQRLQSSDDSIHVEISEICYDFPDPFRGSGTASGAPEPLKKFRPFEKICFSWYGLESIQKGG